MKDKVKMVDLAIIGSGMAGMAGALYASNRKLSTVQIGDTGGFLYTSGLLDLLAIPSIKESKVWDDPWAAIQLLSERSTNHPYSKTGKDNISSAFAEIFSFFNSAGLPYTTSAERNTKVITAMGTRKTSYGVPTSMLNGAMAFQQKKPCLLIDIFGMKAFSAMQIKTILKKEWPQLRAARIKLSDSEIKSEIYGEHLARSLDLKANRQEMIALIKANLKADDEFVGLPAILGVYNHSEVLKDFEAQLGVTVFEIPTMPISIPGLRIKEVFEKELKAKGVKQYLQNKVIGIKALANDDGYVLDIGKDEVEYQLQAKYILLATGRFLSKGLIADRTLIKETVFNLPVFQPSDRDLWHQPDLFSQEGHLINQAGIETDDCFRAVDEKGAIIDSRLFVTGSILAHQDWKRMKCGAGISITSAYVGINKIADQLKK